MAKYTADELYDRCNTIYDAACKTGTTPLERVLCNNEVRHGARVDELCHYLTDKNASILEVGCGNGELYKALREREFTGPYTGIDINHNLLSEAKSRFPDSRWLAHDILTDPIIQHDYVLMSGLFNLNFGQNECFINDVIRSMFAHCSRLVAFDAISIHVNTAHSNMYYINPAQCIDYIARNVSTKFALRHSFLSYNFTVAVYKE